MDEVTATELSNWANRIEARGLLPELIGRLVAASTKPKNLPENNFPTQEGTNSGGWDGHTESNIRHTYVPLGVSGWEMGCNKVVRAKADGDYSSRVESITPAERKNTNFLFVTPRRWASKAAWAKEKDELNEWKSVKVLDAEDIIKWCHQHPAVMLWLQEKIKGESGTSKSATDEWHYLTASLKINLPATLLTSGREADAKELAVLLTSENTFSSIIHSQSITESKIFILSVINTLPKKDKEAVLNKTVIADTEEAYLRLIKQPKGLIIIPNFDSPNVGLATEAGHSVITPQGKTRAPSAGVIDLKPLNIDSAANSLKSEFDDFNEAYEMARLCKISCVAFLRRLSKHPELRVSKWAKSRENGPELLPALLAGAWRDDNEQDKKILEELASISYEKYVEKLQAWSIDEDPPVLKSDTSWRVVDPHDANLLITSFVTLDQYKKFEAIFRNILSSEDPSYDLPPNERWMSNVQGYSRPYSSELIEGVARTMARLVSTNEGGSIEGYATFQASADYIIQEILSAANDDPSGKKWYSLREVFSVLAETSPEVFLEAVEKALKQQDSVLKTLFVDDSDMFTSSPHTSLLFALETLAWNKNYLPRVALCLAGLAEIDPGGKVVNRPYNSLHDLLSLTMPQTDISQKERMEILDLVIRKYPGIGKRLTIGLIPDSHETYIETRPPVFRKSWPIEKRRSITYKELYENISSVVDRLLGLFETNLEGVDAVVDTLTNLPPTDFDKVLAALKRIKLGDLPDPVRLSVWSKMRDTIHHHREFPEAKWSYPKDRIDALEEIYKVYTPDDKISSVSWLFTRGNVPILNPDGHNWENNQKIATDLQLKSVQEIYKSKGLVGIHELAFHSQDPFLVGFNLEQLPSSDEKKMLAYLNDSETASQELVRGYIYNQARTRGVEIIKKVLDKSRKWSLEQKAALIKSAPPSRDLWNIIEQQEEGIQREYWSSLSPYGLGASFEDYPYLAEQYLKYERPYEALAAINYSEKKSAKITSQLMLDTLNMAKTTSPVGINVSQDMIGYYVEETLKHLSARDDVAQDDLVRLQILYYPLLRESRGESTRELQNKFSKDPELFIELISLLYRAKSEPKKTPTEDDQKKAELAHRIIEGMHMLPGAGKDGVVDYEELKRWTDSVRKRLKEVDRVSTGEHELGAYIYRCSMADHTENWPRDEVCHLLDDVDSDRVVDGFVMQAFNYGGPRFVSKEDTTDLEHASSAEKRASEISTIYPQAARVLRKVAAELRNKNKRLFREN